MESASADASGRTYGLTTSTNILLLLPLAASTNFWRLMRRTTSGPYLQRPLRRLRSKE